MLSLLYIAILAVPLTLLALAFLIIAVRSAARGIDTRAERRGATPLAPPPSQARGLRGVRGVRLDLRRVLSRALDPDADAPARRVAAPRQPLAPVAGEPAGPAAVADRPEPLPPGVPTKQCPDCAETVLAAARICKHCRHRFEGWDELLRDVG
ncbi:MAG TPA: zinc ribbon domain-containing protein [Capillimicrobium sp.]|nr:zinc ribbon domain-containing protein [Capillimicrobium sp.]